MKYFTCRNPTQSATIISAIIFITTIIIQTLERTLSSREAFIADDHACSDYSRVTHREWSVEGEVRLFFSTAAHCHLVHVLENEHELKTLTMTNLDQIKKKNFERHIIRLYNTVYNHTFISIQVPTYPEFYYNDYRQKDIFSISYIRKIKYFVVL